MQSSSGDSAPAAGQGLPTRVALVTGGSRGIGRATCLALAAKGAAVAVLYRTGLREAQEVVGQITAASGQAVAVEADLLNAKSIQRSVDEVVARFGRLDILVNNAGAMTPVPVAEMKDEEWEEILTLNLTAPFRYVRQCVPLMKEQRWGRIISVSSQAAYRGSARHAHYAAAKAGLLGFTFSLAREVAPFGITVNAVAPGRIATDLLFSRMAGREEEWLQQTPMRRFGRPEEVAAAIAFLASEEAGYITGAVVHVNGGLIMR